jgi:hypothetical protein
MAVFMHRVQNSPYWTGALRPLVTDRGLMPTYAFVLAPVNGPSQYGQSQWNAFQMSSQGWHLE